MWLDSFADTLAGTVDSFNPANSVNGRIGAAMLDRGPGRPGVGLLADGDTLVRDDDLVPVEREHDSGWSASCVRGIEVVECLRVDAVVQLSRVVGRLCAFDRCDGLDDGLTDRGLVRHGRREESLSSIAGVSYCVTHTIRLRTTYFLSTLLFTS